MKKIGGNGSMSEKQKTIVLTGASRGIGHATAIRFYNEGWRIITYVRAKPSPRVTQGRPPLKTTFKST